MKRVFIFTKRKGSERVLLKPGVSPWFIMAGCCRPKSPKSAWSDNRFALHSGHSAKLLLKDC
jgi:hypothetical protein